MPEKCLYKSLIRLAWFAGPYVTSVGGTIKARPEMAANLSGGGFSVFIESQNYQDTAVNRYLKLYPDLYDGLFECVRCRDLAFSYFVICAAMTVVRTPTSPRKRKITNLS